MRIVMAGGGHANLVALDRLGRRPLADRVELVLVSEAPEASYSGMMPGWVEGLYDDAELAIPLAPLAARAGARLLVDRVVGLDAKRRTLALAGHGTLGYDVLVLNLGSAPQVQNGGDLEQIPVKPFRSFRSDVAGLLTRLRTGGPFGLAVVGGGVGGVELALAFCARARREDLSLVLTLVERGPDLLGHLPAAARRRLSRRLDEAGIDVVTGATVAGEAPGALVLSTGREVAAKAAVWATGGRPAAFLAGSGLALDPHGFVATGPTFASLSHPEVLAVGDVGTVVEAPRPKAGVWSVRAGVPLARQLRRLTRGQPLRRVRLQREALVLVSVGGREAVGTRSGLTVEGAWVWRWKDFLDRRFVGRFPR